VTSICIGNIKIVYYARDVYTREAVRRGRPSGSTNFFPLRRNNNTCIHARAFILYGNNDDDDDDDEDRVWSKTIIIDGSCGFFCIFGRGSPGGLARSIGSPRRRRCTRRGGWRVDDGCACVCMVERVGGDSRK